MNFGFLFDGWTQRHEEHPITLTTSRCKSAKYQNFPDLRAQQVYPVHTNHYNIIFAAEK